MIPRIFLTSIGAAAFCLGLVSCDRQEERTADPHKKHKSRATRSEATAGGDDAVPVPGVLDPRKEVSLDSFKTRLEEENLDDLQRGYRELMAYLREDPCGTLESIDKMSPGTRRDLLLAEIFRNYPKEKHAELIGWADKSNLPEDRKLLHLILNAVDSKLSVRDLSSLYSTSSNERTKQMLAKFAAWKAVKDGVVSLSQEKTFMDGLSPEDRTTFADNFAQAAISKDPVAAGSMIMAEPDLFDNSVKNLLGQESGMRTPKATSQAIVSYTEKTGDYVMLGAFVKGWFGTDSMSVSQWASSLPGPMRDEAYLQIALELRRVGDSESAHKMAASISDEAIRSRFTP